MNGTARPVALALPGGESVSGLLEHPPGARALYVFAHGAGAGMAHAFMAAVAQGLATRGIASLRFNFPAMERGAKRPDPPVLAQATVRAAVEAAGRLAPDLPLFAGGKSFGGRMTSQAQAAAPLAGVRGLVFVGFPLHPANRPGTERAAHLEKIACPMLFLQGTRDALADVGLVQQVVAPLRPRARLVLLDGADHSFHVLARSGRRDADVLGELLDAFAGWLDEVLGAAQDSSSSVSGST